MPSNLAHAERVLRHQEEQERRGRHVAALASAWNTRYAVGTRIAYRSDRHGLVLTTTRSRAQVLGGHSAVIWLENVTGCVALEKVTAMEVRG